MIHRHLKLRRDVEAQALPSAAVADLLERGDLADWEPLRRAVVEDPHGELADRLLRLLDAFPMYGTSRLWRAWVHRLRDRCEGPPEGHATVALSDLRGDHGLTQTALASRLAISQSDLSKLERRANPRLATLRSYARALGGRLRLLFVEGGRAREVGPEDPRSESRRRRR